MGIYEFERSKARRKFLYDKEEVNGVRLVEGQKLFIDDSPAIIIRAWAYGIQTKKLIAVCVRPYRHLIATDVSYLMYETELALNPDTESYRDVKVRIRNREDDFDVLAYTDQLSKKYEDS